MFQKDPEAKSLPDLLRRAATQAPGSECLRFEEDSYSFSEIDLLTSQFAVWLREQKVSHTDRVAIMMGNRLGWPVTWLGLQKVGAITVPINSSYQAADLEYVLQDSGAKMVVTTAEHLPLIKEVMQSVPTVEAVVDFEELLPKLQTITVDTDEQLSDEPITAETIANFQYTSGTTGFPKACILTNDYWLRIGHLAAGLGGLTKDDVVMTAQPFSYMDPQWNLTMAITALAPLVVIERFSASGFWNSVRKHGVTIFYVLGTMPTLLLKQPESEEDKKHSVRMILCSGIPPTLHRELEERWGAPWREAFGMTESGVDLISPLEDYETVGTGAIGKPVPGKQIKIVNPAGEEVADGEIGEMIISGKPMMQGYWNKPEATAETIVDGWLHTGDLVRRDGEGRLFIVGRIKEMIRRGGENISSAEVESVVNSHDAVLSSAAVPEPDELFGEEVKVFVKLKPEYAGKTETDKTGTDKDTDLEEIAKEIFALSAENLARFKVPRFISFVDDFPLTPSLRVSKPQLIKEAAEKQIKVYERR